MDPTWIPWIAFPLLGALIGYITNQIAVRMIFRPVKPVNLLGYKLQGLMPRRQQDLADSIGRVVGGHLVQHDDVVSSFSQLDLEGLFEEVLDKGMGPKIEELRSLPLIGGFLTDERIAEIRDSIAKGILSHRELIFSKLEEAITEGLDIQTLVAEKVAAFPMPKLEKLVLEVASKELRSIEILGGLLGLIIGVAQAAVVHFFM